MSDTDELLASATAGAWYLVLELADAWLRVASADGGLQGWVRLDSRLQIVSPWEPPARPPGDMLR